MTQPTYREPITTGHKRTRDIDRVSSKYFVYTLSDAEGTPIYVGRSCNVASRIKAHLDDARHSPYGSRDAAFKASWVFDVRSVSMDGPLHLGRRCGRGAPADQEQVAQGEPDRDASRPPTRR